jgi:hypothetical protein
VKHTIAELAAAEGRLLSIGELLGRAWQLGKLLAARKDPVDHGKWMIRYRRIFASLGKTDSPSIMPRADGRVMQNAPQSPLIVATKLENFVKSSKQ